MARLDSVERRIAPTALELTPVHGDGHDATEYRLGLISSAPPGCAQYRMSVVGWQMEHDEVWYLARIFAAVRQMVDAVIPIDVWRTGGSQRAYAFASAEWLEAAVVANRKTDRVSATFYVRLDPETRTFRKFFVLTSIEQAERFGLQLEREIIESSPEWASNRGLVRHTQGDAGTS